MTLESMLSDTKYAFRALRRWLQETIERRPPSISKAQSQPECQHRVLIASSHDFITRTPCADCGKWVNIVDYTSRHGRFYIVPAPK